MAGEMSERQRRAEAAFEAQEAVERARQETPSPRPQLDSQPRPRPKQPRDPFNTLVGTVLVVIVASIVAGALGGFGPLFILILSIGGFLASISSIALAVEWGVRRARWEERYDWSD